MRISDWSSDVCSSDLVDAVGGHAVAGQLGVDARAARLGVFVFLQHQHAAAAGDDEAVASGVVGTRGAFGRVVVVGGQRAHRVDLRGPAPVQFLAAAGEHHVLAAVAVTVAPRADAVGDGGPGP